MNKTCKKVLIATGIYPPEIGGPATYAFGLSVELPKRGIDVDVLPFRDVRKYPKIIRHLAYFWKIILRSRGVDVIFTQDPVSTGLPAILAARLLCKKIVLRVAGDYAWEQSVQRFGVKESIDDFQKQKYGFKVELLRKLEAWSVRHADVVIAPSKYFANLVSGWNGHTRKVLPIYNGIKLEAFKKETKSAKKTIISAGRMVPWKGFDTLISYLPELPGWELVIAGDGPDKERLMRLARENKVIDRVKFLGMIAREDLYKEISKAHIFALLTTFESFSFQLIEAMYVGTPVIVNDIGNLSEIVTSTVDGILVNPGDKAAFFEAIRRIETDHGYAIKISNAAMETSKKFGEQATIDRLVEVFDPVLK
jgi:glycosyltransferase involved in cell wall biosynthesis